ncbi:DUF1828 domain-containing protein [Aureimonas phyllosphaerae]|uniref:DUF1828 domain-containing protein n=1 Tax=Aureimonas phyllosphaerae TaxID=1166078 RepID=A0A7W6BYX4_9HYPH|nr:DUF1828 domain-containing protein [Aureimonas phyllosphaerae]MBB3937723.1 hypothetical protein [Aureimonas phyllosphaerae]MBB3961742.1 hypothetical protein [Aureimonas phyllosphaerae]SFF45448.1 protein of unknown function DUF1828 [Aureimonas phyllosphaerae]
MKAELCKAFCDDITVTVVPAGLAVSTAFIRDDGDRIAFYVVDRSDGLVHLEDDGATIPMLEQAGVDFGTDTRQRALDTLLSGVGAFFDHDDATVRTLPFPKLELPSRALAFIGVMIRMNDFLLLTQEKAASTFREDAAAAIRDALEGKADIRENEIVDRKLKEVKADMVLEARGQKPVAVFFGNTPNRIHDAIFLHQAAAYEVHVPLSVVALLEQDNSVPADLRRRASNRLTTVPVFRDDEEAAVARIVREVTGAAA